MDTCSFHILWPGGNTTAIVDTYPKLFDYRSIAKVIMNNHPEIEQVGFLSSPKRYDSQIRLDMMGGEFCGNAARSVAYLRAAGTLSREFGIEVSGFEELIKAVVVGDKSTIVLPGNFLLNRQIEQNQIIIDLQGIRHIILINQKNTDHPMNIVRQHMLAKLPAIGVMYVTLDKSNSSASIDPHVYVQAMDQIVSETACGSGSIAAALALYKPGDESSEFTITQPSGAEFCVRIESKKGEIQKITLGGPVKYLGRKNIILKKNISG